MKKRLGLGLHQLVQCFGKGLFEGSFDHVFDIDRHRAFPACEELGLHVLNLNRRHRASKSTTRPQVLISGRDLSPSRSSRSRCTPHSFARATVRFRRSAASCAVIGLKSRAHPTFCSSSFCEFMPITVRTTPWTLWAKRKEAWRSPGGLIPPVSAPPQTLLGLKPAVVLP